MAFGNWLQNAKEALAGNKLVALANNKQFMEGAMNFCACVAWADGEVEEAEKAKMGKFIEKHPSLQHFDKSKILAVFRQASEQFEFSFGMGYDAALKQIKQVTDPEQKQLMARLAVAIAASDGEIEPSERTIITRILQEIGLDPAEYLGA